MNLKKINLIALLVVAALAGCKKQDVPTSEIKTDKALASSFPTIKNLTDEQAKKIDNMLRSSSVSREEVIKYVNSILATQKKSTSSVTSKSTSTRSTQSTTPFDETPITDIAYGGNGFSYVNFATWMGYDTQFFNGAPYSADLPKWDAFYKSDVMSLEVRGITMFVDLPYQYRLRYDETLSHDYYYEFRVLSNNAPTMNLSGQLGQLTWVNRDFNISSDTSFGFGVQSGTSYLNMRENRVGTLDTEGNYEIRLDLNLGHIGDHVKSSRGYSLQTIYDIQAYFRYECDFLFYGNNTGYQGLNDQDLQYGINPFSLLKPIVATMGEKATYIGPSK